MIVKIDWFEFRKACVYKGAFNTCTNERCFKNVGSPKALCKLKRCPLVEREE